MKILVTGQKGKIGTAFLEYISEKQRGLSADTLSLRSEDWKEVDLSIYDAIYYCIGIVDSTSPEIFNVNAKLAYEFAEKAKLAGVRKFIYLSSMAVYDFSNDKNLQPIERNTIATCPSPYGASKLAGEEQIKTLADEKFEIHIVRAPSIYGRNCEAYFEFIYHSTKRGYLVGFTDWKRSILYVDNLSELICLICESAESNSIRYYFPQNKEQYSYSELADIVVSTLKIKRRRVRLSNKWEKRLAKIVFIRRKYRPYAYSEAASDDFNYQYCVVNALKSIENTLQREMDGKI